MSRQFDLIQSSRVDGALSNRNKIINGAMVIDQRNAGASVTPAILTNAVTLDRWNFYLTQASKLTTQQNAGAVSPPVGFSNYLGVTSTSAYSVLSDDTFVFRQKIEGYNVADLALGTADAKTFTVSFWVRSSLTGSFGGAFVNGAVNRSYTFSYTISSADTWEYKTITVAGDTSGTWLTNNSAGLEVRWGLGSGATFSTTAGSWQSGNFVQPTGTVSVVGTNGATFYLTGVQLEAGDTATPFEHRSYGQELALCQRYYYLWKNDSGNNVYPFVLQAYAATAAFGKLIDFPVSMRSTPTVIASGSFSPTNSTGTSQPAFTALVNFAATKQSLSTGAFTGTSGLTAGDAAGIIAAPNAQFSISAEL